MPRNANVIVKCRQKNMPRDLLTIELTKDRQRAIGHTSSFRLLPIALDTLRKYGLDNTIAHRVCVIELYNNWRTCSYTSFSQQSVRKNMADFE
jgi:hypothetical protein